MTTLNNYSPKYPTSITTKLINGVTYKRIIEDSNTGTYKIEKTWYDSQADTTTTYEKLDGILKYNETVYQSTNNKLLSYENK